MPVTTPLMKINRTKSYGAEVILHGNVYDEACAKAYELAEEYGYKYINKKQTLDDIVIYPSTYVAGGLFENVKESFAVHCILHSWKEKKKIEQMLKPLKQVLLKFLKRDPISMMDKIITEESNNK